MNFYDFRKIEKKWQKRWEESGIYHTDLSKSDKKFYCLVMFPYPSADKLHIGHWYNFGPSDTYARFKKMQGYNVFEPMGFDSFGLPAENYAVKTGLHPKKTTQDNIDHITTQLKQIGAMYDWSKIIVTSRPDYYKWTQWLFVQLYKKGLAFRAEAPVNWCPSCKTVLANEQVIEGRCERCDTFVVQKKLKQWFFKITQYADKLLKGLKELDWPKESKKRQKDWVGKSEGAIIKFQIPNTKCQIETFSTRADTLFGATYIVLAPEKWQELNSKFKIQNARLPSPEGEADGGQAKLKSKIQNYINQTKRKTAFQRQFTKDKTGVFTGIYAINPSNDKKIPVWISDYVLPEYGTGAIMCVPAHDQRDFEFAKKFGLLIKQVIREKARGRGKKLTESFIESGIMQNSGQFDGMNSEKAKDKIIKWLANKNLAKKAINYKLKDWLISRQRYWGAPIPIIYCQKCGEQAVPEKDLPVLLPENVDFKPTGKSPLTASHKFVNIECPKCGGPAKRETDTLDTFVCSSWYFLRYLSPTLQNKPFDNKLTKVWLPVDLYIGGREHVNMHLVYARFLNMVLHDLGFITFDEPFPKLRHQGVITKDGAKMSKSKGNVVNPDEFIDKYGSDTFRMYMMFMGPYDEGGEWSDKGIVGIFNFLKRVYKIISKIIETKQDLNDISGKSKLIHKTIKNVTFDLEKLKFNTAISKLMIQFNGVNSLPDWRPKLNYKGEFEGKDVDFEALEKFLIILASFAPHLVEELWGKLGHKKSTFVEKWPKYDEKTLLKEKVDLIVQVNGKLHGIIKIPLGLSQEKVEELVKQDKKNKKYPGQEIKKVIFIPNRLINFVV